MTTIKLVEYLKQNNSVQSGFIDSLKISYRPFICPFDDLLKAIPENSAVFDIGCGSGMFLSLVSAFRNPRKLGGIEISEGLIGNAKKLLNHSKKNYVQLTTFDGKELPDFIADYDYIFMIDVYHHIPKDEQISFLQSLYERMSGGSFLIFKDIEGASILSYWNKIHDMLLSGEIGHEPKSNQLIKLMTSMGFEVVQAQKRRMWLYPHFTFKLRKPGNE